MTLYASIVCMNWDCSWHFPVCSDIFQTGNCVEDGCQYVIIVIKSAQGVTVIVPGTEVFLLQCESWDQLWLA